MGPSRGCPNIHQVLYGHTPAGGKVPLGIYVLAEGVEAGVLSRRLRGTFLLFLPDVALLPGPSY